MIPQPSFLGHLLILSHAYGLRPPHFRQSLASVHVNLDTAESNYCLFIGFSIMATYMHKPQVIFIVARRLSDLRATRIYCTQGEQIQKQRRQNEN